MAPTVRRAPPGRAAPRVASPGRASRDRELDEPRRRPALPAGACFDLPQIGPTGIEADRVGQRRERVRELGLEQHAAAAVEQRDPIAVGTRDGRPSEGLRLRYRSEEHTSELQSRLHLVCRLLLEKKNKTTRHTTTPHSAPLYSIATPLIPSKTT